MFLKYKNFHICMDWLILIEPGTPKILSLTDQHWGILKSVFHIIFDLHVVVFPGLGGPWMAVLLPDGFLVSYSVIFIIFFYLINTLSYYNTLVTKKKEIK